MSSLDLDPDITMTFGENTTSLNMTSLNTTTSNMTSTNLTAQKEGIWNVGFSTTIATIMSLSAIINIIGNCMVLTVIIRHRGMRTRTNLFLVNLAVADILVGVLVVPFSVITLIEQSWIFGEDELCKLNTFFNSFCLVTSIHTLMYISMHKYFSIVRPLSSSFKLRTIFCFMSAAWLWAGFSSTVAVVGFGVAYKEGTSQCGPIYPNSVKAYIIHVFFQVTTLILPFG